MKKIFLVLMLVTVCSISQSRAQSIAQLTTQLILDIQKLSTLKDILNDMYKDYQILDKGYTDIKNIVQGNFNLHEVFLDGLLLVSPNVQTYERIKDIVNAETSVISEYKSAYSTFQSNGHFTATELNYISNVYTSLVTESLKNIDELTAVLTANQLRMSDNERITAIDRIYNEMQSKLGFLRQFNKNTSVQGLQRARDAGDVDALKNIYGISD